MWQRLDKINNGKLASPRVMIMTAGGACLFSYLLFAILPLFIPRADFSHFPPYLALPDGGLGLTDYYLLYILICINALLLFGLYFIALRAVSNLRSGAVLPSAPAPLHPWRRDSMTNYIFGMTVLFHLVMLLTPFLLSTDLFDYIRHGRIFAIYGENPLVVPATYFPHDPFFNMGGWVGTGSVYGPLHVYAAGFLAVIAGNGIGANFLVFKSFFVCLDLANVILIGSIAARLRPGLEKKAMLFYGWNPFILALVVASAHNDIFMLVFVLAGILCYLNRRLILGAFFITLAVLVKFIALPILLVYIALSIRKQAKLKWRLLTGAGSLAVAVATILASYAPLWEGRGTFSYLTAVGEKVNFTIPQLIHDVSVGQLQLPLSITVVQLALAAALVVYLTWHALGVKNRAALVSASAGIAFLMPLALLWFQPWYLTMALGLIALRPWRLIYKCALLFSFTVMFFDSFWWHSPLSMDVQETLRVLVVFGPPVALLVWSKGNEILPKVWKRLINWSLENSRTGREVKRAGDPGFGRLSLELTALFVAALAPLAIVVSYSPHLRELVTLVGLKFQSLINF